MTRQEFKEALVGKYLLTDNQRGALTRGRVKDIFFTPVATTANVVQVRDDGKEFSTYIEESDLEKIAKKGSCVRGCTKGVFTLYVIEGEGELKKDLPLDTLVMCKRTTSELVGWRVEYYAERGATKPDIISEERRDDWLYVVPLRYFHPTSPDWQPEEKYNWANFGEEKK
ncbi:MAG: hypothetical protein LUC16_02150 [Coprobacillus sp.]|nr:hypothetical protein [Coprobacillus sp.]